MLKNFAKDESGLEMIEWAILVGLIVGGLIATLSVIGIWVTARYSDLQTQMGA